jgi:hypothetical protein
MPPVGFEPAIPAIERPQIHALNGTATGIGMRKACVEEKTNARGLLVGKPKGNKTTWNTAT